MKRSISLLLVVGVILSITSPLVLAQESAFQQGFKDGVQAGNSDLQDLTRLMEAAWGFLFGPFSITHSLVTESALPARWRDEVRNRDPDYREGFESGYLQTVNQNSLVARIGGFGVWLAIWALVIH